MYKISLICYKICIVRPSGGVGLNTYTHIFPPGEHYQDPRYHYILNVYLLRINKKEEERKKIPKNFEGLG